MSKHAELGDIIELQKQDVEVVSCQHCDNLMVNIDADEIHEGDLTTLKRKGVRLSNPETKDEVCLKCDVLEKETFGEKLSSWFDTDDDDDDSSFFSTGSTPIFGGSKIGGGFGGSFGGFGGGSFSGGGSSRSF